MRSAYSTKNIHKFVEIKWYSIKREDWMKFINILKGIQKPVEELSETERNLWDCYYIAKNHGKNDKGLLELPWKRRETVMNAIAE